MPAGDRTGPWGAGPRTGRGFGYCTGYAAPGHMYPGPGLGFGRGFGRGLGLGRGHGRGMGMGRGRRFRFPAMAGFWGYPQGTGYVPPIKEEETLARQAAFLEAELGRIRERLGELEKARAENKTGGE